MMEKMIHAWKPLSENVYFILIKWECIIAYWIAYRLNNNFYWYLIMILQSMKCLKIFGKIIIPLRFISKICGDFYRDKMMIDEVNITYSSIIYFFYENFLFFFFSSFSILSLHKNLERLESREMFRWALM